jgi:hypothetical protein
MWGYVSVAKECLDKMGGCRFAAFPAPGTVGLKHILLVLRLGTTSLMRLRCGTRARLPAVTSVN